MKTYAVKAGDIERAWYVVDAEGQRVSSGMVADVGDGPRHLYEIRMPSDHFAILVRQE